VHDGGEGALVDSGFGDEKSVRVRLDFLKEHSAIKVRYILLTHHHFDHTSGAQQLRKATGAQVVLHASEEKFLLDSKSEAPQDLEASAEENKQVAEAIQRFRDQAARPRPTCASPTARSSPWVP